MPEAEKKGRDKLRKIVANHHRNTEKSSDETQPKKTAKLTSLVSKAVSRRG
ncbi:MULTISPECIES: hypothetical protein [Agrobacterium]|uniref:hypothetical protein n=1 Tax=Agrobacterium TaxID=357 RepID=UPI0009D62901|nr:MULTISPECIES: hypothetical protein [Agrobacterium]CUX23779.1 hypothetical protein AGR6A_Cc150150 [Agrobacterium sp. NCPPB 925]